MLHHPCILGGSQQKRKNQKSKRTLGVTMMLLRAKRGFKNCPGFLNSAVRLGEEGGNATSPLHSRGSPTKRTKSEIKTIPRSHHDAPTTLAFWVPNG